MQIGHLDSFCSFGSNSVTVFPEDATSHFKMRYQRQYLGFFSGS